VLARERVERSAQHVVAGGAAQAGIEAERRFLADSSLAGGEIGAVEFTAEQRFKMRELEPLDEIAVLRDDRADFRHVGAGVEDGFARLFHDGRNRRPQLLDRAAGRRVELVQRVAAFNPLDELAWQKGPGALEKQAFSKVLQIGCGNPNGPDAAADAGYSAAHRVNPA